MDTGTHVVMGIALGAIAAIDPVVASSNATAGAVMLGTILGSQAPDLDTILKLKNNAKYIRHHRGITHSIPAVLLWPLLISGVIFLFNRDASLLHLWLWTFLAVAVHVFVDIFNGYGTQALRPISKKWVALGIINTFDPFIFFSHILAILIWKTGLTSGITAFTTLYIILTGYYLLRAWMQYKVAQAVRKSVNAKIVNLIISPTYRFNQWHLAVTTERYFYVARAFGTKIKVHDQFERCPLPDTPVMKAALADENVAAFLSFSPVYRWEIEEFTDHFEVRFIDLRYRSKDYYPFVAIVQLNNDFTIASSYTGWIFSEEKLRKKLELVPS